MYDGIERQKLHEAIKVQADRTNGLSGERILTDGARELMEGLRHQMAALPHGTRLDIQNDDGSFRHLPGYDAPLDK